MVAQATVAEENQELLDVFKDFLVSLVFSQEIRSQQRMMSYPLPRDNPDIKVVVSRRATFLNHGLITRMLGTTSKLSWTTYDDDDNDCGEELATCSCLRDGRTL
jgi:hypothetical protein